MKQRSLVKNSIYNMVYRGLNVLFPLITTTYVSRILFAAGVGKVSKAQNIAQYFITLAALGIPNYGIREIAKCQTDEIRRNQTFSELYCINFISTLFFTAAYYFMVLFVPAFREDYALHLVVGTSIALNFINVDWFYQGIEEYRYIALRSFLLKIFSLVMILLLIRKPSDTTMYAAINCIAVGGNYVYNMLHLRKYNIRFQAHGLDLMKHMKPILILLASVISIELYTLLDTTMVGVFCNDENVGYYTNAMKLIKMLITMVTAIAGVLLPRLSYHHSRGEEAQCAKVVSNVFSIMLFIFIPCQIGIFLLSDEIMVTLFGATFAPAGLTLKIASFLICTLGFSNLFGTQVLLTYGKEKLLLATTVAGAVSNVIMNAIMIPVWAQNGAALASVISETLVTVLSFCFARKYLKTGLGKGMLPKTLFSGALLAGAVMLIRYFIPSGLLAIVVSVVCGALIFFVSSIAVKNPILNEAAALLRKPGQSQN